MSNTAILTVGGQELAKMLAAGAALLSANMDIVNDLNVFPIPDGDTGTNMKMTLDGGARAASRGGESISAVADAVADGMLYAARGNSGVILSQFFAGIARGLAGCERASAADLARALAEGVQSAYRSVRVPTEGTMLTVIREAADEAAGDTVDSYLSSYIAAMHRSLDRTPELLPVLREAGVVDSGGAGLIYIFEGMLRALGGEVIEAVATAAPAAPEMDFDAFGTDTAMELGYCTELLLRLQTAKCDPETFSVEPLVAYLEGIGNSIVATKSGTVVKIHVHTLTPGAVLDYAQRFGEFLTVKIENMQLQHSNTTVENRYEAAHTDRAESAPQELKRNAFITVATGEGLTEAFRSIGADYVISGGQTMNPSAEDFLSAVGALYAENIFILPNNSNILLTAEQAAALVQGTRMIVVPTRTIAEGYAALSMLDDPDGDPDEILAGLTEVAAAVATGEVTTAVRDCELSGVRAHKGDHIGIAGKQLLSADPDRLTATERLLDRMDMTDKAVLLVIFGQGVPEEELEALRLYARKTYPELEWYALDGGQDVYSYILALE